MIACVDVDYRGTHAVAAAVVFRDWADPRVSAEVTANVSPIEPYEPGAFYKRELPCLLSVLGKAPPVGVVVVDGYVWLASNRPGLGARLHEALGGGVIVVGVAKTAFRDNDVAAPVLRGASSKPLYVTALGATVDDACTWVRAMHGAHRIPTMIARADALSRR